MGQNMLPEYMISVYSAWVTQLCLILKDKVTLKNRDPDKNAGAASLVKHLVKHAQNYTED